MLLRGSAFDAASTQQPDTTPFCSLTPERPSPNLHVCDLRVEIDTKRLLTIVAFLADRATRKHISQSFEAFMQHMDA